MTDRIPPHDISAERTVLGSAMTDAESLDRAVELLTEADFYAGANAKTFGAMRYMQSQSRPVDIGLLAAELRARGELESVGGEVYLAELSECMCSSQNVPHYCNHLRSKALLREVANVGTRLSLDALNADADGFELLDRAQAEVFGLNDDRQESRPQTPRELMLTTLNEIESRCKAGTGLAGISTGFPILDRNTGGLVRSDLIILAGRPGSGKSALAMQIADNAASIFKKPVAVFSLEMSKVQLMQRLLSLRSGISTIALRTGDIPKRDFPKLSLAAGPVSELPMLIDDAPGMTPARILAKARRMKRSDSIELIIVDYLQLLKGDGRYSNRQEEVSEISRQLKLIAKSLDIPVLALCQLSRAAEQRGGDHKPQLSDLRESGAIEQDADMVLFVHRPELYGRTEENHGQAEIIIGKQRNGPTGVIPFKFEHSCCKFIDAEENSF